MNWFDIDKKGLAKLVAGRGKVFVLHELLANAWDEDGVKSVEVTLSALPGVPKALLRVTDDSPNGFRDLADAWTLFAESYKKGQARKRGRFNLGEKLVLALCDKATITTTTGQVIFDEEGRRAGRGRTERGTTFEAVLAMTREELAGASLDIKKVIPPDSMTTTFNGERLDNRRAPVCDFRCALPTVLADGEGVLRPTQRETAVYVCEPLPDEVAMLYEMGVPVVETGDRFHVNVQQKVPLNADRDNVTPAYLRRLRVEVANATAT